MNNRFNDALTQLPKALADAVSPMLTDHFAGHLSAEQLKELSDQSGLSGTELYLALLPIAATLSYAPISNFFVGAIAHGESGDIYMGANMELVGEALFHSVHAEQSAISHAWLAGEQKLVGITVNYSPCGHCRQFMTELNNNDNLTIRLPEQPPQPLTHYLPYAFGPKDLGMEDGLLDGNDHEMTLDSDDPLVQRALREANASYAPYSNTPAAIVLATESGQVFVGRYAENAAFNPSLPPMQMAINAMARQGIGFDRIHRAILVEGDKGQISFLHSGSDALGTISQVQLETYKAQS
ncbi:MULTISPECIES: cytidine deaminase [Ferrimonas]|uniref:cytidine deaminase n=1 Tax=Ferrimonas TaxID=44011 RepID=UPI00040D972F|nr:MULTISPECIES: cytidine deaminase [Ferrimonas]USD38818.1 cytidine deaminase [Ferrimonas sp. SCSIO 43195]